MKPISLSEMKPFVRYARYTTITSKMSHPQFIPCDARLFYGLEGSINIEINDTIYTLTKGDLILFPAGTRYHICTPTDFSKTILINFDYTFENSHITIPVAPLHLKDQDDKRLLSPVIFDDAKELSSPIYIQKKLDIMDKLHEIVREYSKKILYHEVKTSNLLSDIIVDCIREVKLSNINDGYARINNILKMIQENYNKNLTNISIGKEFGLHPNYISSLVKQYTGIPLHKYILYARISHSIDMLGTGNMSVSEVAEKCGFCDVFYFSRYFKQYMGISPNEYKKQTKN